MDFLTKLEKLRRLDGVVLYKWTAARRRLGGDFIPLNSVRLHTITCEGGRVTYSAAAPVVFMERGRSVIKFLDANVLNVMEGPRKGLNIVSSFLKREEEAAPVSRCESLELTSSEPARWIGQQVLSIGCSHVYPVSRLITPELFRMSKRPENLKPLFSLGLVQAIGGTRADTLQQLKDKFLQNLERLGSRTDDGWVVSNDYISSGGCCVVASRGITMRSGSVVHSMPLQAYRDELFSRKWSINTGETNDNLQRTSSRKVEPANTAAVDSDDRP